MRSPIIMSSFLSPFLVLVFLLTLSIPLSLSSNFDRYKCRHYSFECGGIEAYYPFWGGDRPSECGHPQLQLRCEDDQTPTILINHVKYKILSIKFESRILKMSRSDYWGGLCPAKIRNTTLPFPLLQDSPKFENITFHYGCPDLNTSVPGRISCEKTYGFVQSGSHGPGVCNSSIVVPINRGFISAGIPAPSIIKVGLNDGFEVKWNISGMNCTDCGNAGGSCGYSIESNKTVCYCHNGTLNGTACPGVHHPLPSYYRYRYILVYIGVGVAPTILILICVVQTTRRRRSISEKVSSFLGNQSQDDQRVEAFVKSYGSFLPQRYSYQDIKKMTNFFSNKLGQGGFGDVYKGQLRDGRLVAVKLLKESKGDGEDFINEVASISTTSHVNVVTFLGFCFEKKKRALVYKFMPNGSLDKYIYDHEFLASTDPLGWNKMYLIALGIARGLEYLHRGCNTRIVHFDIKPHNILLDEDFCPKISDFGLSKLCIGKESSVSMLIGRGTPGYIAPEIFSRNFGHVSHKSDVYSYGMLIIEIVVGRKNMDARLFETSEIYFADWIYKYTEPENLFELQGVVAEEEKEMAKKMILVSLWCIQPFPSDRPPMSKVVEMLEGEADNLQIPPKPSLSSSPRSIRCFSQTSALSSSSTSELRIGCPSE